MNDLHVYDTTLRDGAQQEGLNLSVADKLAIAGPPRRARGRLHRGRVARRQPQGHRVLRAGPGRAVAAPRDARRVRRHAARRRGRGAGPAGAGAARLGRPRRHARGQEPPASRRDGAAHHARRRTSRWSATPWASCGPRGAGSSSTPSTSSTATSPTAPTPWRCCGPRTRRAPRSSPCATPTAACSRRRSGTSWRTSSTRPGCAWASTATTTPAVPSPTPWPPWRAGASHVQGTINGYGERTGNADLLTVVSNLQLKLGRQVLPDGRLEEATRIAHAVSEVTNVPPYSRQPYVGASAFAHKAGLHASAIKVDPDLYQHTDPMRVGNDMRMLVSDMAGRASIELKARELGYDLAGQDDLLSQVRHPGQGAGAAGLHLRRRRRVVRAAAAREVAGRPAHATSRSSPGGSSPTPPAPARRCPRRPSSSSRPAGGSSRPVRATVRSTRSTTRCGRP